MEKRGVDIDTASCRNCKKKWMGKEDVEKAIKHAEKTGHTVDVDRRYWEIYSS